MEYCNCEEGWGGGRRGESSVVGGWCVSVGEGVYKVGVYVGGGRLDVVCGVCVGWEIVVGRRFSALGTFENILAPISYLHASTSP